MEVMCVMCLRVAKGNEDELRELGWAGAKGTITMRGDFKDRKFDVSWCPIHYTSENVVSYINEICKG